MSITDDESDAVEMQGHGRSADIDRDFSYENRHAGGDPSPAESQESVSAVFCHDGWVKEALDVFAQFTSEALEGSGVETEHKRLSPTPNEFPSLVKRVMAMDLKPYDFGADKLAATKAPMFFVRQAGCHRSHGQRLLECPVAKPTEER